MMERFHKRPRLACDHCQEAAAFDILGPGNVLYGRACKKHVDKAVKRLNDNDRRMREPTP